MLPDVHARAGMECGDCHSMKSLMAGKKSSKTCVDCHKANPAVIEHSIDAHQRNLECYACHSAWASQEYGTFFVRFKDSSNKQYFRLRPWGDDKIYQKRFFKKTGSSPPLGINTSGKISPVRPQFIVYFTEVQNNTTGRRRKPAALCPVEDFLSRIPFAAVRLCVTAATTIPKDFFWKKKKIVFIGFKKTVCHWHRSGRKKGKPSATDRL